MAEIINTKPGNWVLYPTQAQKDRTLANPPHFIAEDDDDIGRRMYLIKERSVLCPDVNAEGAYPETNGRIWRSAKECRKCPYQRSPKGRRRLVCSFGAT